MAAVDLANLVASWLSFTVTAVGLFALVAQAGVIKASIDPFYRARGPKQLGRWAKTSYTRDSAALISLVPSRTLRGPAIDGDLRGICTFNEIYMSRCPTGQPGHDYGDTTWTKIWHVLHPWPRIRSCRSAEMDRGSRIHQSSLPANDVEKCTEMTGLGNSSFVSARGGDDIFGKNGWRTEMQELVQHERKACNTMSRITFITLLVVSNAYQCYLHNGDSGLRAMFSGYTGSWQVVWPIGRPAVLEFLGLDSHPKLSTDSFPLSFKRRVDKCLLMLMGMIFGASIGKIGFSDVKDEGRCVLEFHSCGGSADSARSHLYYLAGGEPFVADMLLSRPMTEHEGAPSEADVLTIAASHLDLNRRPISERRGSMPAPTLTLYVPPVAREKLATALDCLPWSPLSWSIHRGMKTVLLAYGEEVMNAYRPALARALERAVREHVDVLKRRGWAAEFVDGRMAHVAKTGMLQPGGDSGDTVRVVVDVALLYCQDIKESDLDETRFWREKLLAHPRRHSPDDDFDNVVPDADAVAALIKYWVIEWSHELDHRIYEILPFDLLVG